MNKKNIGVALIVVGGALALGALVNMNPSHFPVSVTSKIPVIPTAKNATNALIGGAVVVAGFWLRK